MRDVQRLIADLRIAHMLEASAESSNKREDTPDTWRELAAARRLVAECEARLGEFQVANAN